MSLAVALAVLAAAPPAAVPPPPPRSLLLVTLDTTRADHLGCYGAGGAATPNIDALARRGTRFDQALSPVPLTLPAHASILTGRPPRLHGVRDNAGFRLPAGELTLAEELRERGFATRAFVASAVLDRSTGIDQGFAVFDDRVRVGPRAWFDWEERGASQVVDAVLASLGTLRPPFFLWVHFYDPHLPYVPPERFRARFEKNPYDGEIAFVDAELGRLMEGLAGAGLDGSLVVAVAGDHGESLGEHGEAAHDTFVYQATQRVPLVLAGPGVPAGRVVRESVGLVDLAPTLRELLNLPARREAASRSLVPLLKSGAWTDPGYELESLYPALAYGWAPLRGLVLGGLKYIEAPRPELYDLGADPRELRNLAALRGADARRLASALRQRFGDDALPAPAEPDARDAERAERLRSLGYAGGGPRAATTGTIDPKDGIAWIAELDRARRLVHEGSPDKAIALLEPILAKNPENLPLRLTLGNALLSAGRVDQAVASHREAVRRAPRDYLPHFNLANALRAAARATPGTRAEAEQEFRRALELHPRHAESVRGLAELLFEQGRLADARDLLADAGRREVEDAALLALRGAIEARLGDIEAAERALARATELDPRFAPAWEARGRIAYQQGRARDAAGHYRRALEAAPSAALARTLGSILLYELDDRAGAREAFRRALELQPAGPDADAVREILAGLD
ncbi:MAG: sulfatase-like hydrolase/transferase [Acidobacteria bacterium]|nr:sulfatase-like hydrolase/transferase [Acidobacteriota bacterium]